MERLSLQKGYRVAEVCATLGCSSRYLHTLFIRDIGLSPKRWMTLERMVVARRMLDGGKSPEQVSRSLGFMCAHSFYRQFQRIYKVTPYRYQRDRQIFDPKGGRLGGSGSAGT